MYICLMWQILPLVMEEHDHLLISLRIFQGKRKQFASNLKCRYCIFTKWGRPNKAEILYTQNLVVIILELFFYTIQFFCSLRSKIWHNLLLTTFRNYVQFTSIADIQCRYHVLSKVSGLEYKGSGENGNMMTKLLLCYIAIWRVGPFMLFMSTAAPLKLVNIVSVHIACLLACIHCIIPLVQKSLVLPAPKNGQNRTSTLMSLSGCIYCKHVFFNHDA